MTRTSTVLKAILAAAALSLSAGAALAKDWFLAVHVDQNDPQVINMALNNVQNAISYFEEKGDTVTVEVVAYGPGLHMYVDGKSPVADRIAAMSLEHDTLTFSACGNTIAGMEKKTGQKVSLLSEAGVVPSGVARLMELQDEGYTYIRP
jgi:intracellular sulfur oxidation DsrE/DsrF family protein